MKCESVVDVATSTTDISTEAMNRIIFYKNAPNMLQAQFSCLIMLVTNIRPHFTAGKLFSIDNRSMFILFNILTTYIIATVQLSEALKGYSSKFKSPLPAN